MKLMKPLTLAALASTFTLSAVADWVLINDFEGAAYEDFNLWKRFAPQGDMFLTGLDPTNPTNGFYYVDPGPQVDGANNQVHNAITLPTPLAADGKGTLRYRLFFFEAGPFNLNIGLSDTPVTIDDTLSKENGQLLTPTTYGDFESQIGWTDRGVITIRNGNQFLSTDVPIPVGEWITVYYAIDNVTDTTQFYYKLDSMESPQIITMEDGSNTALFRNGTDDPLVTLNIISAGSNSGPVSVFLLDDIYFDPTGINLDGGDPVEGDTFWAGYKVVNEAGDADTGGWLGWVNTLNKPWIYVYSLNNYLYLEEDAVTSSGAWAFAVNF
jgi:hypothetical protein